MESASIWTLYPFWILAALFALLAAAFVLVPLLRRRAAGAAAQRRDINIAVYRDQMKELEADHANGLLSDAQLATARTELEARLAEDAVLAGQETAPVSKGGRLLGLGLGVSFPVAAFGLYFLLGNPQAMLPSAEAAMAGGGHDIAQLLQNLEEKVKANPKEGKGWLILGKTYAALERWPDAVKAYEQAVALLPQDASAWSGYGEALAIHNNRELNGKPMEMIRKALELDEQDSKALELMGIQAFQEKNYAQAAYYWKQLYKQLPPDSPYAQDIKAAMDEAKKMSEQGISGKALDNLADLKDQEAAAQTTVEGVVELAPALKGKVGPGDTVFLFARPASGGGAPLAAIRASADKLPIPFQLSDAMAMMPDNKLSNHQTVTITARVSKSGTPEPRPGDLEGQIANVKVGSQGIKLVIDKVRE